MTRANREAMSRAVARTNESPSGQPSVPTFAAFNVGTFDAAEVLPPRARERFEAWRDTRDDAQSAYRRLSDEVAELRAEAHAHRGRLQQLRTDHRLTAYPEQVADAEARLAKIEERIRITSEKMNAKGALHQQTGRLVDIADRYVRSVGAPLTDAPVTIPKSATLTAVRDRIADIEADVAKVEAAPVPSSLAKAKVRAIVASLAEAGRPDAFDVVEAGGAVRWPDRLVGSDAMPRAVTADGTQLPITGLKIPVPDTPALLAWLFPDQMAARLEAEVEALSDDAHALTDEQRAERLATLRTKLLEAERVECALAERDGAELRPDADPRALLAVDGPAPR